MAAAPPAPALVYAYDGRSAAPAPELAPPAGLAACSKGWQHTVALSAAGAVLCAGDDHHGQLGTGGGETRRAHFAPAPLPWAAGQISSGGGHTLALQLWAWAPAGGGAVCSWGCNSSGELGRAGAAGAPGAVQGLPAADPVAAVAAGVSHSLALTQSGAVYGWGYNHNDQLGLGSRSSQQPVALIAGLSASGARRIAAGGHLSAAETGGGAGAGGGALLCAGSFDAPASGPTAPAPLPAPAVSWPLRALAAACVPPTDRLAAADAQGAVWLWTSRGAPARAVLPPGERAAQIALSCRSLVALTEGGQLWDCTDPAACRSISAAHPELPRGLVPCGGAGAKRILLVPLSGPLGVADATAAAGALAALPAAVELARLAAEAIRNPEAEYRRLQGLLLRAHREMVRDASRSARAAAWSAKWEKEHRARSGALLATAGQGAEKLALEAGRDRAGQEVAALLRAGKIGSAQAAALRRHFGRGRHGDPAPAGGAAAQRPPRGSPRPDPLAEAAALALRGKRWVGGPCGGGSGPPFEEVLLGLARKRDGGPDSAKAALLLAAGLLDDGAEFFESAQGAWEAFCGVPEGRVPPVALAGEAELMLRCAERFCGDRVHAAGCRRLLRTLAADRPEPPDAAPPPAPPGPPAAAPRDPPPEEEWARFKGKVPQAAHAPMERLLRMVGLTAVKRIALRVCLKALHDAAIPAKSRCPETLNFSFLGNPGTGKTTVARIFGELLHACGARCKSSFVAVTAQELLRQERSFAKGAKKISDRIQEAMGGVLFVDEAYALDPASSAEGRAIVDELLTAAEDHREDLSIVLAGYKEDVYEKVYSYNPGMRSRFRDVEFTDMTRPELKQVLERLAEERGWEWASPQALFVAWRRVCRGLGRRGFGNGREARGIFEGAVGEAAERRMRQLADPSKGRLALEVEDVIGPRPSRETIPQLHEALSELEAMHGLKEVKERVQELIELAAGNYTRELLGETPFHIPLNRIFIGNPGTGKTTVAGIYGRVLHSLRLLSGGQVELRTASDFVGSVVGETQKKAAAIIASCTGNGTQGGKVLVIDEAYNLDDGRYGKEALDTIVEKVSGRPGEDIAVILVGYERQILKMLRDNNPGLRRRFYASEDQAVRFADYDSAALRDILQRACHEESLGLGTAERVAAVRYLDQQRQMPNFGNAGAVGALVGASKARAVRRLRSQGQAVSGRLQLTKSDLLGERARKRKKQRSPGRQPPTKPEDDDEEEADDDPLAPLDELYSGGGAGAAPIRRQLEELRNRIRADQRDKEAGMGDGRPAFPGGFVFRGNPGTGKTTVARVMGCMLGPPPGLNVLPTATVVQTTAAELTGAVVGEAKNLVTKKLEAAQGGILFVDEAYELGKGPYGEEAMATLLNAMTEERYATSTIIVFAGYRDAIDEMLGRNDGMRSRFKNFVDFPDWEPADCSTYVVNTLRAGGYEVGGGADAAAAGGETGEHAGCEFARVLHNAFAELRGRAGWANARDAVSMHQQLLNARANRLASADAPDHSPGLFRFTYEDADAAARRMLQQRPARRQPQQRAPQQGLALQYQQQQPHAFDHAERSTAAPPAADPCAAEHGPGGHAAQQGEDLERGQRMTEEIRERRRQEEEEQRRLEEEAERLRRLAQQAAEEERRRLEAMQRAAEEAARRIREKLAEEQRVRERLRGRCPMNFEWIDRGSYYQCAGGSHIVHK